MIRDALDKLVTALDESSDQLPSATWLPSVDEAIDEARPLLEQSEDTRKVETACDHGTIRTLFSEGVAVMWACDNPDCARRFYPACLTCVDVGHRSIEHPGPAATPSDPAGPELREALADADDFESQLIEWGMGQTAARLHVLIDAARAALAAHPPQEAVSEEERNDLRSEARVRLYPFFEDNRLDPGYANRLTRWLDGHPIAADAMRTYIDSRPTPATSEPEERE